MAAPAEIWIYRDPKVSYLIAKRQPFQYQLIEGDGSRRMLQGIAIPTPTWSHVQEYAGVRFGFYQDQWYDITDLGHIKNPSPP